MRRSYSFQAILVAKANRYSSKRQVKNLMKLLKVMRLQEDTFRTSVPWPALAESWNRDAMWIESLIADIDRKAAA